MSEEIIIKPSVGRKTVSKELVKLRGQQAAMYKLKGFTYEEVLRKINEESIEKKWSPIGMSQLKKDIAKHMNYLLPYSANEMREVQEGEKMMYLAELDRNYNMLYTMIVQAVAYYQNEQKMKMKGEEKPIVNRSSLPYYIDLLIKTGEHLAKLKGWEKLPVPLSINFNNNELNIYDRAREDFKGIDPAVTKKFTDFLDGLVWKDEESNGLEAISGMDEKSESNEQP